MKREVIFVCAVKASPEVEFIRKTVDTLDITQVSDIPETTVNFWFESIDQNGKKMRTPITTIGKLFTREEILGGKVPDIAPERIQNIDCDGAIKTKVEGLWSWYHKGMPVVDLP